MIENLHEYFEVFERKSSTQSSVLVVINSSVCLLCKSKVKDLSPPSSGQPSPVIQSTPDHLPVSTQITEPASLQAISGSNSLTSFDDSPDTVSNASLPPLLRPLPFGSASPAESLSLFSDMGFSSSHHMKPVSQNFAGLKLNM